MRTSVWNSSNGSYVELWVDLTIKAHSKVNYFDVRISGRENGGRKTEEARNDGVWVMRVQLLLC